VGESSRPGKEATEQPLPHPASSTKRNVGAVRKRGWIRLREWEQKAGDTPAAGPALPLACAGWLAAKRLSARAEGEALSHARRRRPRSGVSRRAAPAGASRRR